MPTPPASPKAYLDSLPEDRRKAVRKLRAAINKGLPKGYKEGIQYGMLGWFVPHSVYPDGYHCDASQPVPFASVASQKNHVGLYLFCLYTDPKASTRFAKAWKAGGRRLDMGKSCIRIKDKDLNDMPLELITETIASIPVDAFLAEYEKHIPASKRPKKKAAARKKAAKKAAKKTAKKKAARRR